MIKPIPLQTLMLLLAIALHLVLAFQGHHPVRYHHLPSSWATRQKSSCRQRRRSSSSTSTNTPSSSSLFISSLSTPWDYSTMRQNATDGSGGGIFAYQNDQAPQPAFFPRSRSRSTKTSSSSTLAFPPPPPPQTLTTRPQTLTTSTTTQAQRRFKVYCDLDGVLVDFAYGIRQLFPEQAALWSSSSTSTPSSLLYNVDSLPRHAMWERVAQSDDFFSNLPWTPEGPHLWQAIRHLQPDILTGIPANVPASRRQKFDWCRRELLFSSDGNSLVDEEQQQQDMMIQHVDMAGRFFRHASVNRVKKKQQPHVNVCNVITCWSSNKHYECSGPDAVLIDDRESLREAWEAKGGIFIHHHNGHLEATLQQLQAHGILDDDDDDDDDYNAE